MKRYTRFLVLLSALAIPAAAFAAFDCPCGPVCPCGSDCPCD